MGPGDFSHGKERGGDGGRPETTRWGTKVFPRQEGRECGQSRDKKGESFFPRNKKGAGQGIQPKADLRIHLSITSIVSVFVFFYFSIVLDLHLSVWVCCVNFRGLVIHFLPYIICPGLGPMYQCTARQMMIPRKDVDGSIFPRDQMGAGRRFSWEI